MSKELEVRAFILSRMSFWAGFCLLSLTVLDFISQSRLWADELRMEVNKQHTCRVPGLGVLSDHAAQHESWGKNPLRCWGCSVFAVAAAPALSAWRTLGSWAAECSLLEQGVSYTAAWSRMEMKKDGRCPGKILLHHLDPSPNRDSKQAI